MSKPNYQFWVYIMASDSGTLYVGMTNELKNRVYQHKTGEVEGFSKKYKCHRLVYCEEHQYVFNAMERERQVKKWNRKKKETLIKSLNPTWKELAYDWYRNDPEYPL